MKREDLVKYLEWSCDINPLPDYLIKDVDDFIAYYQDHNPTTDKLYRIKKERVHEVISALKAKLNSNLDFTKESFCNNLDTFRDEILSLPVFCQPKDGLQDDLKQYMTNLLYSAYDKGREDISEAVFDTFVEEWIDGIDGYFKSL